MSSVRRRSVRRKSGEMTLTKLTPHCPNEEDDW
jgi:hypothetical protein